jgi:hypothetical protein
MDPPKTRRELKKTAREKRATVYTAKHARIAIQSFSKRKLK